MFCVTGDAKSTVHGYIIDGLYQGRITLSDGQVFTVERKEKHKTNKMLINHSTAHSVIYKDEDIRDPHNIMRWVTIHPLI